jgi:hypothetical protein
LIRDFFLDGEFWGILGSRRLVVQADGCCECALGSGDLRRGRKFSEVFRSVTERGGVADAR